MNCPNCGEECERDEVDVGVGIIYGPWGCSSCCWSSDPRYDRSGGVSPKAKENPGWYVDQWGGMQRISAIAESAERFGIPREVVEEAFREDG
jgi:hypothetical protein